MDRDTWAHIRARLPQNGIAWPTLFVLVFDMGLLVVSARLSFHDWWAYPLAWLLEGLALLHLYLIHHETVHGAVFCSPWSNALLGHGLGACLLYPFLPRQQSHWAHHRWAGHPHGDPTNRRIIARLRSLSVVDGHCIDALWRTWLPFLAFTERVALWRAMFAVTASASQPIAKRLLIANATTAVFWAVLVGTLAWHRLLMHFLLWYVPGMFFLLVAEELVNLPHHADAPLVESMKPMEFWRQDEVTHSCQALPFWSSAVLLNFNLHTAHHYYPSLPWYRLPLAERLAQQCSPLIRPIQNEMHWGLQRRKGSFVNLFSHMLKADSTSD